MGMWVPEGVNKVVLLNLFLDGYDDIRTDSL